MIRAEVYKLIDNERDYQDRLGPDRTELPPTHPREVGESLTMMATYFRRAQDGWTEQAGNEAALDNIRKIAAIAVRCMEDHGAPERVIQNA